MRVTSEVYLVGGGTRSAFGLSNDPDGHIYLIDGGDEMALVECGMGMGDSLDRVIANIEAEGLDLGRLRYLLLTHYHMDHAGGAAQFRSRLGLEVIAPWEAAEALRTGDERAVSLDFAKQAGFYPPDYRFEPVEVGRELVEGDRVQVGNLEIDVYETPGHCDGHVSYCLRGKERRYLFAGDAVFHSGRIVLQNIHDCSIQKSGESVEKLAEVEFEAFLPGHMAIALSNGRSHVETAAEAFGKLFVPDNLM